MSVDVLNIGLLYVSYTSCRITILHEFENMDGNKQCNKKKNVNQKICSCSRLKRNIGYLIKLPLLYYETSNNEIGRSAVNKYDMIGVYRRIKGRHLDLRHF